MKKVQYLCILFVILLLGCKADVVPVPYPTYTPDSTLTSDLGLTLTPGVTLDLARIPAGEFLMGSTDADSQVQSEEKPQHSVTLSDYLIGKYEVTNAQFAAFVKATGYKTTAEKEGWGNAFDGSNWVDTKGADWQHPTGPNSNLSGKDNHPVVLVSWDDAVAFCAWASQVTGRTVKLPTEAQWEKVARGTDGRKYPWGNQAPNGSLLNYADRNLKVDWADKAQNDGYETTAPVGNYPKGISPYGALDMAGNVWEWTSSLWGNDGNKPTYGYPYNAHDGREDQSSRDLRVVRGGGWRSVSFLVRAADRLGYEPWSRLDSYGFRVAVASAPGSGTEGATAIETPTATRVDSQTQATADLSLTLAPNVTLDLVRIPAGEFLMGSTDAELRLQREDDKPQHSVTLSDYLIGKYEVTNAQFAAFVKATGYKTTAEKEGWGWASYDGSNWVDMKGADWQHPKGPNSNLSGKDNHPVVLVSWDDAVAFCAWASQATGRKVTLPTEAQWEKAARGTDGRIYPWGNTAPNANLLNFNMNEHGTTAVGKYSLAGDSPYGVADMVGNVSEWTSSLWGNDGNKPTYGYPYNAHDGREDQSSRDLRVLRGGGWINGSSDVRAAYRIRSEPSGRVGFLGFRVAVSAPGL